MSTHDVRPVWLMDLGNTRLKCARLTAAGLRGDTFAIGHEATAQRDELEQRLLPADAGTVVHLASVAPAERTVTLIATLQELGMRVQIVSTLPQAGRLRIAYPVPSQLGVDRFLGLLAASQRDDGPWLIVSAGSALTVDLLLADGTHVGGAIAPMPSTMREALARQFTQLALPAGTATEFASNTADAIASGTHGAMLGLVEHALRDAAKHCETAPTLLLAGGGARQLAAIVHQPIVHVPALVLDGMAVLVRLQEP